MLKRFQTFILLAVMTLALTCTTGCETDAQNTALLGTAIGAGVGALAGGDTEGALIGAAVGGGAGYVVGNESDKKQTQRDINAVRAEQNTVSVWITNSNNSQYEVKLRKDGPGFRGPRNEYYPKMPTNEELAQVYGF